LFVAVDKRKELAMKQFLLGFGVAVAMVFFLGVALHVLWDYFAQNRADRDLGRQHYAHAHEIALRVDSAMTREGKAECTPEAVVRYPVVQCELPEVAELRQEFLFLDKYFQGALARGGSNIPVVLERLGQYEEARGGNVGFVRPARALWLNETRFLEFLKRLRGTEAKRPNNTREAE
jgi:hypothetical protein